MKREAFETVGRIERRHVEEWYLWEQPFGEISVAVHPTNGTIAAFGEAHSCIFNSELFNLKQLSDTVGFIREQVESLTSGMQEIAESCKFPFFRIKLRYALSWKAFLSLEKAIQLTTHGIDIFEGIKLLLKIMNVSTVSDANIIHAEILRTSDLRGKQALEIAKHCAEQAREATPILRDLECIVRNLKERRVILETLSTN